MTREHFDAIRDRHVHLPARGGSEDIDALLAFVAELAETLESVGECHGCINYGASDRDREVYAIAQSSLEPEAVA